MKLTEEPRKIVEKKIEKPIDAKSTTQDIQEEVAVPKKP